MCRPLATSRGTWGVEVRHKYPSEYALRRVETHDAINWMNGRVFLGEALAGETVGVEEGADGWCIWFGPLALAWLAARQISDRGGTATHTVEGPGRWSFWTAQVALQAPVADQKLTSGKG